MNSFSSSGRLCADPDMRFTQGGTAVCNLRLAINVPFKKDDPLFLNFTIWGKQAELVSKNFKKGDVFNSTGHLESDSYEYQGNKRTTIKCVIDILFFPLSTGATERCDRGNDNDQVNHPASSDDDDMPF